MEATKRVKRMGAQGGGDAEAKQIAALRKFFAGPKSPVLTSAEEAVLVDLLVIPAPRLKLVMDEFGKLLTIMLSDDPAGAAENIRLENASPAGLRIQQASPGECVFFHGVH